MHCESLYRFTSIFQINFSIKSHEKSIRILFTVSWKKSRIHSFRMFAWEFYRRNAILMSIDSAGIDDLPAFFLNVSFTSPGTVPETLQRFYNNQKVFRQEKTVTGEIFFYIFFQIWSTSEVSPFTVFSRLSTTGRLSRFSVKDPLQLDCACAASFLFLACFTLDYSLEQTNCLPLHKPCRGNSYTSPWSSILHGFVQDFPGNYWCYAH